MKEPTNIAFMGDVHGDDFSGTLFALAHQGVDTVVQVGDYGYTYSAYFVKQIEEACAETGIELYFVDGNHDKHEYLYSLLTDEDGFKTLSPHVHYIPRGHRWEWWDKTWMGLGGAHSVDRPRRIPNISWWATETQTMADHAKAIEGGHVDILIAHDAPPDVVPGLEDSSRYFPAEEIALGEKHREGMAFVMEQVTPTLLVHGHYHRFYTGAWKGAMVVGLDESRGPFTDWLWIVAEGEFLI